MIKKIRYFRCKSFLFDLNIPGSRASRASAWLWSMRTRRTGIAPTCSPMTLPGTAMHNVLSRCDHISCIVPDPDGCYWAQKLTPTLVNPTQVAKTDKDICAASLVLTLLEMQ